MRKLAAIALALVALSIAAVAQAGARSPIVPTRATLDTCHTGAGSGDRYAIFAAQMGAMPRTARMQLRFALYGRTPPSRRWRHLWAPGLDAWSSSARAISIFRYRKEISALPAPGSYRAVVRYRWLDARGHVLRTARRTTPTCHQPDPRPDLVPDGVTVMGGDQADRTRYLVGVRNRGRGDAGPFAVRLVVAGRSLGTQTVPSLLSGAGTTVSFEGDRCPPGAWLRVVVDSAREVAESHEGNNVLTSRCPGSTTR